MRSRIRSRWRLLMARPPPPARGSRRSASRPAAASPRAGRQPSAQARRCARRARWREARWRRCRAGASVQSPRTPRPRSRSGSCQARLAQLRRSYTLRMARNVSGFANILSAWARLKSGISMRQASGDSDPQSRRPSRKAETRIPKLGRAHEPRIAPGSSNDFGPVSRSDLCLVGSSQRRL